MLPSERVPDATNRPSATSTPRLRARLPLIGAGLLLGVVPPLTVAPSASAHSALLSSDPSRGALLPTAPSDVTLVFNEDVAPQFIDGAVTVGTGPQTPLTASVDGAEVVLVIPQDVTASGAGATWTVAYRVVSADGHPISDSVSFEVEQAQEPSGAATPDVSPTGSSSPTQAPVADPSPSIEYPAGAEGTASSSEEETSGWTTALALSTGLAATAGLLAGVVVVIARRRRGRP